MRLLSAWTPLARRAPQLTPKRPPALEPSGARAPDTTFYCKLTHKSGAEPYIVKGEFLPKRLTPDPNANKRLDVLRCPINEPQEAYMTLARRSEEMTVEILRQRPGQSPAQAQAQAQALIQFSVSWRTRVQVRGCPAWKCVACVGGPSYPGTPTPSLSPCRCAAALPGNACRRSRPGPSTPSLLSRPAGAFWPAWTRNFHSHPGASSSPWPAPSSNPFPPPGPLPPRTPSHSLARSLRQPLPLARSLHQPLPLARSLTPLAHTSPWLAP